MFNEEFGIFLHENSVRLNYRVYFEINETGIVVHDDRRIKIYSLTDLNMF
jgi:hypothetical protein